MIMDKNKDIDISLLEGPLLYEYVDADYLINLVSSDDFLKKFEIEENEFNKITLEKKKKVVSAADADADADAYADADANAAADATKITASKKIFDNSLEMQEIIEDVNKIPNISKIKIPGEKVLDMDKLKNYEKAYISNIKASSKIDDSKENSKGNSKGKPNKNWLQTFYKNQYFTMTKLNQMVIVFLHHCGKL